MKPTKEQLIEAYNKPGASVNSLKDVFKLSHPALRKLFSEYNISRKTASQITAENSGTKSKTKLPSVVYRKLEDEQWLLQQITSKRTIPAIANELNCSVTPIIAALRKFGIETDGRRPNNATNRCLQSYDWMFRAYSIDRKSMSTIATELNLSVATVQRWVHFHGLDITNPNSYPRKHIKVSAPTQEIADYITTVHNHEVELNNRTICSRGLEIDIVVPSANLGIEYHGLYSHIYRPGESTFSRQKGPQYHVLKTEEAEHQGYKLYQFYSDEWREKRDIIQSIIAVNLGKARRIFARNCDVHYVSTHDKNAFLNANHLQGSDKSKHKYGLYHDNELVAVMTFSSARFNRTCQWELVRFAVKQHSVVIGGFSKLLAHARRDKIQGSIVSYADRRYSQGNVYEKNGFVKTTVNKPSYYYVDTSKDVRYHRMHFQKKNLTGDKAKTEFELATEAGYHRIYDCGTITYVLR